MIRHIKHISVSYGIHDITWPSSWMSVFDMLDMSYTVVLHGFSSIFKWFGWANLRQPIGASERNSCSPSSNIRLNSKRAVPPDVTPTWMALSSPFTWDYLDRLGLVHRTECSRHVRVFSENILGLSTTKYRVTHVTTLLTCIAGRLSWVTEPIWLNLTKVNDMVLGQDP